MKVLENIKWNDWHWQSSNSYIDGNSYVHGIDNYFKMKISPYYYNLIDSNDVNCPIKKQAIPSDHELKCMGNEYKKYGIDIHDSLAEENLSPVANLVHRYPDRVLMIVTNNCFTFCRFCTRKRIMSEQDTNFNVNNALDYISANKNIRDVLISGGDPLTLEDEQLEEIICKLRKIQHVKIIRIGTRAPVVMPMRITNKLVNILKKYHPIWINTHFNHPKEITEESAKVCRKIIDAGIPLGNQSVLLRGVNDNIDILKELFLKLAENRVRPYYLYQCDLGSGIDHFRTKVKSGIDLIRGLRQHISGLAIPTYVIDAPNGGGKIAVNPDYIIDKTREKIVLQNSKGNLYVYPEIIENEKEKSG